MSRVDASRRRQLRPASSACYVSLVSIDPELAFQPLTVRLRDDSEVTVRAIRAADADELQAAIRSISDEGRYFRFFSSMDELTPQLLDRAVHSNTNRELQLVAVVGPAAGEKIVAGTRYSATKTDGDCEFAVAVIDGWQGRGLARFLLETLIAAARARGYARMEGYILASNVNMLRLAKRLGFVRLESDQGPDVYFVRKDLAAVDSDRTPEIP